MNIGIDIFKISDLIDQKVNCRVLLEFQRMGSAEIKRITGIIRSKFSNEISPACKIEADEKIEEVFMDELVELQLIS